MTQVAATSGSVATQFDTIFAVVITGCAEFCAGARQGRDLDDLVRLGPTRADVARPAPTDTRH